MHTSIRTTAPLSTLLFLAATADLAPAQMRFSTDWNGASVGATSCGGIAPITEGDLLKPCSGVPELHPLGPSIAVHGGGAGLGLTGYAACSGSPGGTGCGLELDAYSSGRDRPFRPNELVEPGALLFSVDAYATGLPGIPAPSVTTERVDAEAAADLFGNLSALPPGALGPAAVAPGNIGVIDGDGYPSATAWYPGLGLAEPTWATFAPNAASNGDDLDAFDDEQVPPSQGGGVYFSLDSAFLDSCSGHPNTGSAALNGFSGADVLKGTPAGPVLYAPAAALGLDFFGVDTDDLDALLLRDNGDGVYQPSLELYDWITGATDMLLFSVRRDSEVIGRIDSLTGTPIEEGDILMPPTGGLSPFPAIFIAAENLGLATIRSGAVLVNCDNGDDLDALDRPARPIFDCNANGVEDAIDIATGASADVGQNGIPDECEPGLISTIYCFCDGNDILPPCGNYYVAGGCENSTGDGGRVQLNGTSSVADDDLEIVLTDLPTSTFGILFMGNLEIPPVLMGDGMRCVGGQICRFPVQSSGVTGEITYGPGFAAYTQATFGAGCWIVPGSTFSFQGWFRDLGGPCGNGSNTTSAATVSFY